MRKRRKKRRKRKKTRTKQKREIPPTPLATPLKFHFMVADKLRSLRLSFAFIENRMTLTTLTTCQILAALVLLPLDFPRSLFVRGAGGGGPRHSEKFGVSVSVVAPTHILVPTPSLRSPAWILRSETWPLGPLSRPLLATLPPPCVSGIYFRGEPP